MRYRIVGEPEVWAGYLSIPDHQDRGEALDVIDSLALDPYPPTAMVETYAEAGLTWARHVILLSSGRGFVSYSPIFTDEGEPAVLLWPVVWCDV